MSRSAGHGQSVFVLVTVTGRDRPGVTSSLFASLTRYDVDVLDVEQVVIRDRLALAVLVAVRGDVAGVRRSVAATLDDLGLDGELTVHEHLPQAAVRGARQHVTVMSRRLDPQALAHLASCIAEVGGNIETVSRLSSEPVAALELVVRAPDPTALRSALVRAVDGTGVDIAVEPSGLRRRAKRLVVMDVDSTLIRDEAIDVLAERHGVGEQVRLITARAMAGELDFTESLRARVALLAGMPEGAVAQARDALRLTPGARTFVHTLRQLGYHVGVVSGGFTYFTDRFVAELGLDFAAANHLEILDGVVTGRVLDPVVDRQGKAEALRRFADAHRVPLSQTVAIGDGANDIDMLEAAGLGVAFNAKAALRAAADTAINVPYLDTVLFVLGIRGDEVAEAAATAD